MRDGAGMAKGTIMVTAARSGRGRHRRPLRWSASGLLALALALATLAGLPVTAAHAAPTDVLTLDVQSARTEPRAFGGAGVDRGRSDRRTSSS